MANAIHSGTAVRASAKLWIESAAKATDPDTTTMVTCIAAVTPRANRLILTARMPIALDSKALSTLSAVSWLCGATISRKTPRKPRG